MRLQSDIQNTIKQASDYLLMHGCDHESTLRYTLLLEEALLVYHEEGSFEVYSFNCSKSRKNVQLIVSIPGKELDPFAKSVMIPRLIDGMENQPVYAYRNGKNTITYKPKLLVPTLETIAFFWKCAEGKRGTFIAAVLIELLDILANILLPIAAAVVVTAITTSNLQQLLYMSIALLVIRLLRDLFAYTSQNLFCIAHKHVNDVIASELTKKVMNIQISSIHKFGCGVFIQRMTNDLERLAVSVDNFLEIVSTFIKTIGIMIGIAMISLPLFVFQAISIVVLLFIEIKRTKAYEQNEHITHAAAEAYADVISDIVRANRDIKLFNGKEETLRMVKERNNDMSTKRLKERLIDNKYDMCRWSVRDILGFLYLLIEFYSLANGKLNVSMAVVLFNYCETVISSVNLLSLGARLYKEFQLPCERLYQLACSKDFPVELFGDMNMDSLKGEITFRNVEFAYPSDQSGKRRRKVLKNMNFTIHPGEYAAIVGHTACGKTTIFNLITKLYEAQYGEVLLDGINIKDLDEDSIRKNIAIVSQNPRMMHMSIRDHLRLAKNDASEEEMINACKKAFIHDEIMRMPAQYDTIINSDGSNLSGGQCQRINIAMAILKNAPILLFDEATSALDNITQNTVQQKIAELNRIHTTIVIAHRLSTIEKCDRILFMDDGRIIADGTHEELLLSCGKYRELYENQ